MNHATLPHTVAPLPPIGAPRYTPIPDVVLDDWILRIKHRSELLVLFTLLRATLGWAQPEVTLTRRQLCTRTGLSNRSVTRAVAALEAFGAITVHERTDTRGRTANCYRLVIEDDPRPGPPRPARQLRMDVD